MKLVVLISGGPDSIFLVNFLLKKYASNRIILVYVNYHYSKNKKTAEEQIVEQYAKSRKLTLFKRVFNSDLAKDRNFQAAARKYRYLVATKIADLHATNIIVTGHQKNDFFETLQLQKIRNGKFDFNGISPVSLYDNHYILKRPILKYTKRRILLNHKKQHQSYFEDDSNLNSKYLRNQVRKNIINISLWDNVLFIVFYLKNYYFFYRYCGYQKSMTNVVDRTNTINLQLFLLTSTKIQKWILRKWLYQYANRNSLTKINSICEFIHKNYASPTIKKFTISENKQLLLKNNLLFVAANKQSNKKNKNYGEQVKINVNNFKKLVSRQKTSYYK